MRDPVDSNHDAPETARSRVICLQLCLQFPAQGHAALFPLALDPLSAVLLQGGVLAREQAVRP
jgi:hypothetical protein